MYAKKFHEQKYILSYKVRVFQAFSDMSQVSRCQMLVSMLLKFEKSGLWTFPTKNWLHIYYHQLEQ